MITHSFAARKSWLLGICLCILMGGAAIPLGGIASPIESLSAIRASPTGEPGQVGYPATNSVFQVFLPVMQGDQMPAAGKGVPIWSHQGRPAQHEVGLFRHTFQLSESLLDGRLQIFADTRYEVWVDGSRIGRGPARFSIFTREYDLYDLGTLERGNHLIAVLVQWAPNNRRSESTTPYLIAHITGKNASGKINIAGSGPQWKSINSDAWVRDAVPVHAWGLIGPTELLDYRRLPANWVRPEFNDEYWPAAVVKDLAGVDYHPLVVPRLSGLDAETLNSAAFEIEDSGDIDPDSITFRARSLPVLDDVPIKTSVLDAGRLSPGRRIGELLPGDPTQEVHFSAGNPVTLVIEVLSSIGQPKQEEILVDNKLLVWNKASPVRPDVYFAKISVGQGAHTVRFAHIPPEGLTFALSDQGVTFDQFPFQQGRHAGRRLLLAEPVSDGVSAEIIQVTDQSLDLELNPLPAYVVLDLGRTIYGRVNAEISGPAGTVVDLGWDERLFPGTTRPLPYPGSLHPQWNQVDSRILDGSTRRLSSIDARAGRYILIATWGKGPVRIDSLQVLEERLPLEQAGEFSSTDAVLEAVWQLGAETMYANMSDAYSDPWRERGQWWGDAYVMDHTNRVVFGDATILRRGIEFMAEAIEDGKPNAMAPNGGGHHMLDYGMLWVQSTAGYVERTGDTTILDQVFPPVIELMAYLNTYESTDTGLLEIPEGPWTQTTYVDTVGQASRYGQSTAVNALYYQTLVDAAELAQLADYPNEAAMWKNKATSIKRAVNLHLFRPAEHRYVTSIRGGTTIAPTAHAQAWALAYGLVPAAEVSPVASSLLDLISMQPQSPEVEIYGTFWVLEAFGKAGMVAAGIDLIKMYYGHLLDAGATTTWEIYNSDRYFTQSLSHGWGSSPNWFLTSYLLGARQTGTNSWEVEPAFLDGQRAAGTLPIPQGRLQVSWETRNPGEGNLLVEAPPDTSGWVILPNIQGVKILYDGIVCWSENSASSDEITFTAEKIHIPVRGGSHTILMTRDDNKSSLP